MKENKAKGKQNWAGLRNIYRLKKKQAANRRRSKQLA